MVSPTELLSNYQGFDPEPPTTEGDQQESGAEQEGQEIDKQDQGDVQSGSSEWPNDVGGNLPRTMEGGRPRLGR